MTNKLLRIRVRSDLSNIAWVGTATDAANERSIRARSSMKRFLCRSNKRPTRFHPRDTVKAGRVVFSISRAGVPLLSTYVANTCWARLKGLFAYPPLKAPDALMLRPCSAVHTFGLNYSIDVLFLDKSGLILKCVEMKPRSVRLCKGSYCVVEMASGTIERLNFRAFEQLDIDESGARCG